MAATFRGSSVSFDPVSLQSAGAAGNYAAAGGVVDVGANFGAVASFRPDFDALSAEVMKNKAMINVAGIEGAANTVSAGVGAFGQAKGQLFQAQAYENAAEEAKNAQKSAAGIGALGGVLSTGLSLLAGPAAPAVNGALSVLG